MCVGKIMAFTINLIKTEKQLGFEFLTEFADEEELKRLKKQK
jgi:indole-3-glycerol phosphate synthase